MVMRLRSLYSCMAATFISGLVFHLIFANHAVAQPQKPSYLISTMNALVITTPEIAWTQNKGSSSVWTNETTISRPPKPKGPRRPKIRARLLTLEYRILKRSKDGTPIETSPTAIFQNDDALQLRIKVNQDGYLHIIQNREGADGELVFPDSRINDGNNFVKSNQEIVIPSNCPPRSKYLDEQGNCWFGVEGLAGREIYTIIFSREAVPDVMNQIPREGGAIKQQDIKRIKESANQITSRPDLSPRQGGGAGRYIQWVTNFNRNNNEELVKRVVLNHN
jgi:Domain of unknown function (DUF4384)